MRNLLRTDTPPSAAAAPPPSLRDRITIRNDELDAGRPLSGGYTIGEKFRGVFGDEESRKKASPIRHVKSGLPAFFLAYAEKDAPGQARGTRAFADALKGSKVAVVIHEAKDRDHGSLFRKIEDGDPTAKAVLEFIRRRAGEAAARK
jgi:hypothetical protein